LIPSHREDGHWLPPEQRDIWQSGKARNNKRSPEVAIPESAAEVMVSRLIILFFGIKTVVVKPKSADIIQCIVVFSDRR